MTGRKIYLRIVFAAVLAVSCFFSIFAVLSAAFSYSPVGMTEKNTIGPDDLLEELGFEISDAEREYLCLYSDFSLSYPGYISTSFVSTDYSEREQLLKVTAQNYEYISEDGFSVLWFPKRAIFRGEEFEFPENADFEKIYRLGQKHRVTAMVAPIVMNSQLADSKVKGIFSKELFKTAARYSAQEKEREDISRLFSDNEIPHCFLKGSKVSVYYDNPDCRFMVDMDLYVDAEKMQDAEKILLNRGYEISSNSDDKDTIFVKKPFLTVELHKELKYDYDKGYDYYKGAFERMNYGDGFAMNMTNEDFYVYILSHVAHHIETAGTGIKSIVDHYYLRKNLKPKCDSEVLKKALEEIGLATFEEKIDGICDFWFENGESDGLIEEMTEYILLSGVFGNEANNYINDIIRTDNNTDAYFIRRLFPPLKKLKFRYEILNKYPFLLPAFWGIRIISALTEEILLSLTLITMNKS